MDRFSRNWYQNFANFSRMVTMLLFLSFTSLPTHPLIHPAPTHALTHLWTDYLEIDTNILEIFRGWLLCGFFKFYISTHLPTHPPTHSHIYGPIFSKLVLKHSYYVVFFKFYTPNHPPTYAPTHALTHLWTDFLEIGTKTQLLCGFF